MEFYTMAKEVTLSEMLVPLKLNKKEENTAYRASVKQYLDREFNEGMNSIRVNLLDKKIGFTASAKDLLRWSLDEIGYSIEIQEDMDKKRNKYYAIIRRKQ